MRRVTYFSGALLVALNTQHARALDLPTIPSSFPPSAARAISRNFELLKKYPEARKPKAASSIRLEPAASKLLIDLNTYHATKASLFSGPFARVSPIVRHEVEPDTGTKTIEVVFSHQVPSSVLAALSTPVEQNRAKTCGDAIRGLREKIQTSAGNSVDRISGFDEVCIYSSGKTKPPPLNKAQRLSALKCASLYQAYSDHCFGEGSLSPPSQISVQQAAGIIVARPAAASNEVARGRIVCSAARVAADLVLTARHCLREFRTGSGGVGEVVFFPFSTYTETDNRHKVLKVAMAPDYIFMTLAEAIPLFISADPQTHRTDEDMMLMVIDPKPDDTPPLVSLTRPEEFRFMTLAGFQRLLVNRMILQARLLDRPLFDDQDMLDDGHWREAFRFDSTPTCLMLKFFDNDAQAYGLRTDHAFGHFCQSLGTASGAGLFGSPAVNGAVTVFGVHAGHLFDDSLQSQGIPVEARRPSNYGVASNAQLIEALTKPRE